jgi:biopolymer transport protein ExbB|tara:strand:+ start:60594 stop:61109 length:516 start_codon:yes stop_codon:yes gene_type:complete
VDAFEGIQTFLDMGGPVLLVIAGLLVVMWTLLFERWWFFKTSLRAEREAALSVWEARTERKSVRAHQVREAIISRVTLKIEEGLSMIKTLVSLAPLLGLLGTVTGMIGVFEVLATTGGGDARSMAAGVSQATIPTMAGMVAALSGVFGNTYVSRIADREKQLLADHLTLDH